jgi:hypothetical protein
MIYILFLTVGITTQPFGAYPDRATCQRAGAVTAQELWIEGYGRKIAVRCKKRIDSQRGRAYN